jgi:hypothetical protein
VFLLVVWVLAGDDDVVSEREPGPVVVTLVWALDEDTLDVFAAEIAAGERVETDAGTIRAPPDGLVELGWRDAPF